MRTRDPRAGHPLLLRSCARGRGPVRDARSRAGITLIEILVVVAIVAMLASVGAVQLLRARMVTHEQLALSSMREIMKACQFYNLLNYQFPQSLNDLVPPASDPPYLDPRLVGNGAVATLQGYTFTYASPAPYSTFTLTANPQTHGVTGERHFYMDQRFMIYYTKDDRDADPASDPTIP